MSQDSENFAKKFKSLSEQFDREVKQKKREYLVKVYTLVANWQGQNPNLRDIFRPEAIEDFLKHSVEHDTIEAQTTSFIDFVIRDGYKDAPKVNQNGQPLSRRTTALHCVTKSRSEIASNLFKIYDRYDVNYTDEDGLTHFHVACMAGCYEVVKKFLELGQVDPNLLVTKTGDSPLHFALRKEKNKVVELLLRAGSDPNLTNKKGSTALHIACNSGDVDSAKMIFEMSDEKFRPVQVNAQDNSGNAPLHFALGNGYEDLMELLLRNGANPNIANKEGATPLHFIVSNFADVPDYLELFIKISREVNQIVQIDARDNLGRTPLQLAVAKIRRYNVKDLLSSGANLSNFVFPDESYFGDNLKSFEDSNLLEFKYLSVLLALVFVEFLEEWGYELKKGDALTIMKCFAKYEMFKKSPLVEERWYEADWFAEDAKKKIIDDGPSFYDLMRLQPDTAAKLLIGADYFKLFMAVDYKFISPFHEKACRAHLCEIRSREFYRRWALPSFKELTRRHNLTNVCCNMIIDNLTNDDLFNICLAAEGQT